MSACLVLLLQVFRLAASDTKDLHGILRRKNPLYLQKFRVSSDTKIRVIAPQYLYRLTPTSNIKTGPSLRREKWALILDSSSLFHQTVKVRIDSILL